MRPRYGFTLAEVLVALALSFFVIIAIGNIMASSMRSHFSAGSASVAQLELAAAYNAVAQEMAEATLLISPSAGAGATLEGCANAMLAEGGTPEALDPARGMRYFAFCQNGAQVHYHSLEGCPAAYTCGVEPTATFSVAKGTITVSFARAPGGVPRVTADLSVSTSTYPLTRSSSFSAAGAISIAGTYGSCSCTCGRNGPPPVSCTATTPSNTFPIGATAELQCKPREWMGTYWSEYPPCSCSCVAR